MVPFKSHSKAKVGWGPRDVLLELLGYSGGGSYKNLFEGVK